MKRITVLLLTLLLLLTGCSKGGTAKDISVEDVCCPYEITHEDNALEITLRDKEQSGLLWNIATVPDDVCTVEAMEQSDSYACGYRVVGIIPGAAQLTVTALTENETVRFTLTLVVNVDENNRVTLSSHEHREREEASVETESFRYQWNVDVNGILHFSFLNEEDDWSVRGDGEDVCKIFDAFATPSGCKFSAEPVSAGQTAILLIGEESQRTVRVILQADENGKLEVISVQEQ